MKFRKLYVRSLLSQGFSPREALKLEEHREILEYVDGRRLSSARGGVFSERFFSRHGEIYLLKHACLESPFIDIF